TKRRPPCGGAVLLVQLSTNRSEWTHVGRSGPAQLRHSCGTTNPRTRFTSSVPSEPVTDNRPLDLQSSVLSSSARPGPYDGYQRGKPKGYDEENKGQDGY